MKSRHAQHGSKRNRVTHNRLSAALERKKGVRPKTSWEKTAADRVELKLAW